MSVISLDAQAIESLNQEIITLDNSLVQNYLPELESELNAINSNVKGDEINPIINTILSQFQGVKSSLSTEMPKLEAFLEQQLKSYTVTEEELEVELTTVMNRMTVLADRVNGVTFGTAPNGDGGANGENIPGTPDSTTEENNGSGFSAAMTGATIAGLGMANPLIRKTVTAATRRTVIKVASKVVAKGTAKSIAGKVAGVVGSAVGGPVVGAAVGIGTSILIDKALPVVAEWTGKGLSAAGNWLQSLS